MSNTINLSYYTLFLPFVENYGWVSEYKGTEAAYDKQDVSSFIRIPYKTVRTYFDYAEEDGFISFQRRTRKFGDKKVPWAICVYKVDLKTIMNEINKYIPYSPSDTDRLFLFYKYCLHSRNTDTNQSKEKEEKNLIYQKQNTYFTSILAQVNTVRPEKLRSNYLLEGRNRETNFLCTTRNPKNDKLHNIRYKTIIEQLGYKSFDDIGEWDAKSSIFRVDYALNHKTLLPHDVDIYMEVWNLCNFEKPLGDYRDDYKQLFMPIFMSDGTKNKFWAGLVEGTIFADKGINKDNKEALIKIKNYLGISAYEIMEKTHQSLKQFLGTDHFRGGSIFIPESNVHILMQSEFWNADCKCINVYDCTYFNKNDLSPEEVQAAHDRALKEVIKRAA